MTSIERVRATLNFEEPDKVPLGHFIIDCDIASRILGRNTFIRDKVGTQIAYWQGRRDEVVESLRAQANEVMESVMPVEEASASFLAGIEGVVAGGKRVSEKIRYEREDMAAARWQSVVAGSGP